VKSLDPLGVKIAYLYVQINYRINSWIILYVKINTNEKMIPGAVYMLMWKFGKISHPEPIGTKII
jgi:hypothetical protein